MAFKKQWDWCTLSSLLQKTWFQKNKINWFAAHSRSFLSRSAQLCLMEKWVCVSILSNLSFLSTPFSRSLTFSPTSQSFTHKLSHLPMLSHFLIYLKHTHSFSLSLSHSRILPHTLSYSLKPTSSFSLNHSLFHSQSHSYTLSHIFSHTSPEAHFFVMNTDNQSGMHFAKIIFMFFVAQKTIFVNKCDCRKDF